MGHHRFNPPPTQNDYFSIPPALHDNSSRGSFLSGRKFHRRRCTKRASNARRYVPFRSYSRSVVILTEHILAGLLCCKAREFDPWSA